MRAGGANTDRKQIENTDIRFHVIALDLKRLQCSPDEFYFESTCEQHFWVLKSLEFQTITAWIGDEHCCLLAQLTFESDVGSDQELRYMRYQSITKLMPIVPSQNCAKMTGGNVFFVNQIGRDMRHFIDQMSGNLVAEEVEVDPPITCPADFASDHVLVKRFCFRQIDDGKR